MTRVKLTNPADGCYVGDLQPAVSFATKTLTPLTKELQINKYKKKYIYIYIYIYIPEV